MKRNLVIGLLITLALVVSGFTYAFWAAGISNPTAVNDDETITVGTGETVSSTINLDSVTNNQGGALVPAGFADGTEIESATITYVIAWNSNDEDGDLEGDASGFNGTLTPAYVSAYNDDLTPVDVTSFFNVSFDQATYAVTSDTTTATVVITITMNEPANQAEYNLLAGNDISLTFSFTVVQD